MSSKQQFRINIGSLVHEFNYEVFRNESLQNMLDTSGDLVLDIENLGIFAHDIGLMLNRAIERVVEFE